MATCEENDMQQSNSHWQHKISGIEIELKEKQFMIDELEYYKEIKTKSKKNAHAENRKLRFLR